MGKKRNFLGRKKSLFGFAVLGLALIIQFQNCSDIRLTNGKFNLPSTPPENTYKAGEWDLCPKGNFYADGEFYPRPPSLGNGDTIAIGELRTGNVMTLKMVVPQNAPQSYMQSAFFSSSYGGAFTGVWNISKTACDFNNPILDPRNSQPATDKKPAKLAYLTGNIASGIMFNYDYGLPGSGKTLDIGETYYLNIRMDDCYCSDAGANCTRDFCFFDQIKLP